jgi:drug/metabolite transporter (DMT)-like permease
MTTPASARPPRALMVLIAFLALYLIWGSTYLGIRFAIESLPGFLMAGVRFVVAGAVLYAWTRWQGAPAPTLHQWRISAIVGGLLLVGGNGGVVWAEHRVDSGLTALLVATVPFWFALFDWLRPDGVRPGGGTILGLALGFAGIVMLVKAGETSAAARIDLPGTLVLVLATISWAGGSIFSRQRPTGLSAMLGSAMQMLAGGAMLLIVGTVSGEWSDLAGRSVTLRSVLALGYLIVFGSLVGYTAYTWLLRVSTAARVATYAYVNPIVAVVLGWALAGEALNRWMLLAAGVIIAGVVSITASKRGGASPAASPRKRVEDGAMAAPAARPEPPVVMEGCGRRR